MRLGEGVGAGAWEKPRSGRPRLMVPQGAKTRVQALPGQRLTCRVERGFTLLELLLVVVLLLLFATVAVINLAPLRQGAELTEGVGQLESLLRFARAEAAQEGRRVQVQLASTATPGIAGTATTSVQVSWEPRPLTQPGVFVTDVSTAPLAQSVNRLVRIEDVHCLGPSSSLAPTNTPATSTGSAPDAGAPVDNLEATNSGVWPPIMFYPDGSSDSAEILVASHDSSDPRRMLVRWDGVCGSATHLTAATNVSVEAGDQTPAAAQPLEPASVAHSTMGQGER